MKKMPRKWIAGVIALFVFAIAIHLYALSQMSAIQLILCSAGEGGVRIPTAICQHYMMNYRAGKDDIQELSFGGVDPILNLSNDDKKYDIAEFYISRGLDVDGINHYYHDRPSDATPLHASIIYNDAKRAKFLIAHGANIEAKSEYLNNMTPLELAKSINTEHPQKDMREIIRVLSRTND